MATVINTPATRTEDMETGVSMGVILGVIVAVILGALFFVYGLPSLTGTGSTDTTNQTQQQQTLPQQQPGVNSESTLPST